MEPKIINAHSTNLVSLELYSEKNECGVEDYYLKAIYERTTKYGKERITIPKIHLGVDPHSVIINHGSYFNREAAVNIGFGNLPILEKDGVVYTVNVLEEYAQKMTLEDIEKKLGHKVEIVSKK